jgi:hypothetical protein
MTRRFDAPADGHAPRVPRRAPGTFGTLNSLPEACGG